jgi:phosphoglycolate phosphatase-like HAD superfamily hydrolase
MSTTDTPALEERDAGREGAPIEAAILDLDGVLTDTASVHQRAWALAFDELLELEGQRPFTREDYLRHVDGKPRLDGVRAFLAARGIDRREGDPRDPPGHATVSSIGSLKDARFHELLAEGGVRAAPRRSPRGARRVAERRGALDALLADRLALEPAVSLERQHAKRKRRRAPLDRSALYAVRIHEQRRCRPASARCTT